VGMSFLPKPNYNPKNEKGWSYVMQTTERLLKISSGRPEYIDEAKA